MKKLIALFSRIIVYFYHSMPKIEKILLFFCVVFICFHIWGALFPSHYNWGANSFAFYGTYTGSALLAAALILIFPATRRVLLGAAEPVVEKLSKIHSPILFLILAGIITLLVLFFPSEGLMMGDSKIILITTPELPSNTEASANFRNQPLTLLILKGVEYLNRIFYLDGLTAVYKTTDLLSGILFLLFVFVFIKALRISPVEKFLTGLLIFAGGGTQFFFGYIENYALLYAFTAGYIVTVFYSFNGKVHPGIPVAFVAVMTGLHLGAAIFLPTVFLFLALSWKERKQSTSISVIALACLSVLVFYISDYDLPQLITRIRSAWSNDFLPVFKPVPGIPYPIFSWLHLTAWLNLNLLVVPLGLILTAAILIRRRKAVRFGDPFLLFLLSATACGIFFTFTINPALGMFRDWDMMASFFIPLIFLSAYVLTQYVGIDERKTMIFIIASLSTIHIAARVEINADKERHLRRAEVLANPLFMGRFAQTLYYDRLGNAFWERKDYARAKLWYERYCTVDSTHPRIIANLAEAYKRMGDNENMFRMLKKSADLGSTNPDIYSNLGSLYYAKGNIDEAIEMSEKAISLNPSKPVAHAVVGLCEAYRGNFKRALEKSELAIQLGLVDPMLFKQTGDISLMLKDYERVKKYYSRYLDHAPADTSVKNILIKISENLSTAGGQRKIGRN